MKCCVHDLEDMGLMFQLWSGQTWVAKSFFVDKLDLNHKYKTLYKYKPPSRIYFLILFMKLLPNYYCPFITV